MYSGKILSRIQIIKECSIKMFSLVLAQGPGKEVLECCYVLGTCIRFFIFVIVENTWNNYLGCQNRQWLNVESSSLRFMMQRVLRVVILE